MVISGISQTEKYRYQRILYLESKKQMNKSNTHRDAKNRLMIARVKLGSEQNG